jgi:hypothetical protein
MNHPLEPKAPQGCSASPSAAPHLPHVGLVNLAHGEAVEAAHGLHHGADLVAAGHVLVDLKADVQGRLVRQGIGLREPQSMASATGIRIPPSIPMAPPRTCSKIFLASASNDSYTASMPLVEMMRETGPVMHSTLCLKASSSLRRNGCAAGRATRAKPSGSRT